MPLSRGRRSGNVAHGQRDRNAYRVKPCSARLFLLLIGWFQPSLLLLVIRLQLEPSVYRDAGAILKPKSGKMRKRCGYNEDSFNVLPRNAFARRQLALVDPEGIHGF